MEVRIDEGDREGRKERAGSEGEKEQRGDWRSASPAHGSPWRSGSPAHGSPSLVPSSEMTSSVEPACWIRESSETQQPSVCSSSTYGSRAGTRGQDGAMTRPLWSIALDPGSSWILIAIWILTSRDSSSSLLSLPSSKSWLLRFGERRGGNGGRSYDEMRSKRHVCRHIFHS